jgi:hypothetical protein
MGKSRGADDDDDDDDDARNLVNAATGTIGNVSRHVGEKAMLVDHDRSITHGRIAAACMVTIVWNLTLCSIVILVDGNQSRDSDRVQRRLGT